MKRVGILTITNSGLNFGNRLQAFALEKVIEELGGEAECIVSAKSVKGSLGLSKGRRFLKGILKNDDRRKNFGKFTAKYIKKSKKIRYEGVNEAYFADKYDLFISGSDQVWNPNFHFNSDFEFASFAPREKRASYAASIGVGKLKDGQKDDFIKNINGMNHISVREYDGASLIKELTGREALVHIDPTMLLDKEVYYAMEEKPDVELPQHYMLTYFLGAVPKEYEDKLQEMADKRNLTAVSFSEWRESEFYHCGPQHFLYVLHHADYICVDSFHGSVFSILFEKPFSIFVREGKEESMNGRIETLVKTFGLEDRVLSDLDKVADSDIDYTKVREVLKAERNKSMTYLKGILEER